MSRWHRQTRRLLRRFAIAVTSGLAGLGSFMVGVVAGWYISFALTDFPTHGKMMRKTTSAYFEEMSKSGRDGYSYSDCEIVGAVPNDVDDVMWTGECELERDDARMIYFCVQFDMLGQYLPYCQGG